MKQKTFWLFVTLAYLITWIPWIPLERFAAQHIYVLPNPQTLPLLLRNGIQDDTHLILVLISLGMIVFSGPLLAAAIVYAMESGKAGLRGLWQTSTRWNIGARWYGIMLSFLLLINLPAFLFGMLKGPLPTAGQVEMILIWCVPMFVYTFFASGLEEPGWRGYALPALQKRYHAKKASVILAIIWGIWHWPVFLTVYLNELNSPGGVPQAVITLVVQVFLYIIGSMISGSLIYTWLYNRTGSVFLCMIFHTLHNNVMTYLAILFPSTVASILPFTVLAQWLIAIVLMRYFWTEAHGVEVGRSSVQPQVSQP